MSSYYAAYFDRVNHLGSTIPEVVQNDRVRDFSRYLRESPSSLDLTYYTDDMNNPIGEVFRAAIQTNKQDPTKLTMRLMVPLTSTLHPGSIINWDNEQWILVQKDRIPSQGYHGFYIVRCNYHIKWVNPEGIIEDCPVFLFSSQDSRILENFRTWHMLITPQPNKSIVMIMPERRFPKYTNLIIKQERWYVVETDVASTPGILYASLGEGKLNPLTDDIENEIADIDNITQYRITVPSEPIEVTPGSVVIPKFVIHKNNVAIDINQFDIIYTVDGILTLDKSTNEIRANAYGIGTITISVPELDIVTSQIVESVISPSAITGMIEGNDDIKVDREGMYKLITSTAEVLPIENVFLSDVTLAQVIGINDELCKIRANDENKLGTFVLYMVSNGTTYQKKIRVMPIW